MLPAGELATIFEFRRRRRRAAWSRWVPGVYWARIFHCCKNATHLQVPEFYAVCFLDSSVTKLLNLSCLFFSQVAKGDGQHDGHAAGDAQLHGELGFAMIASPEASGASWMFIAFGSLFLWRAFMATFFRI